MNMRDRTRTTDSLPQIDRVDRIIAACITPIFFNLSSVIVITKVFRRSRYLLHLLEIGFNVQGALIATALIGIPAAVGYALGTTRGATLLGHFFCTNDELERHAGKTVLAWGSFFVICYVLARLAYDE
jgi:hypothetical protein